MSAPIFAETHRAVLRRRGKLHGNLRGFSFCLLYEKEKQSCLRTTAFLFGRGRRILNPCLRQYLRKPIVQSCADAANCMAICGVLHGIVHYEKGKKPMLPHRLLSFLCCHYKIDPYKATVQKQSIIFAMRVGLPLGDDGRQK